MLTLNYNGNLLSYISDAVPANSTGDNTDFNDINTGADDFDWDMNVKSEMKSEKSVNAK